MTKEKEKELVFQALKSADVQQAVNQTCRHIIIERLRNTQMNDRQLRIALEDVVNHIEIPVDIAIEIQNDATAIERFKTTNINRTGYVVTMIVGAVIALLGLFIVRLFGVMLILGSAALYFFKSEQSSNTLSQPVVNSKAVLKVKSTVDDIIAKIDTCYNSMQPMFGFNQLDGRYQHVLEWLQDLHSRLAPEKRTDVEILLEDIGYEIVAFDDAFGDFFEFRKANVPNRITSKYAIRNSVTGRFILNGTVVFPLDN